MRNYVELTKPRITLLILICTAVGCYFGGFSLWNMIHALLGTALMASGTAALNQWYESDIDGKMLRTRARPIPSGRVQSRHALIFGVAVSAVGFVELWLGANVLAAGLGMFTLVTYLLLYTPLKRRSPVCTTIGAIPGAMPSVIGYAAASGRLSWEALALFAILFIWQFPHFYSIAWLYRGDYARGGVRMLPGFGPTAAAARCASCSAVSWWCQ
jgi:protoheme IX farnesyltransferase